MSTRSNQGAQRRSLVALSVGLALVAASSACSSNNNSAPAGDGAAIVVALPEEPVSLDPCDATYTENSRVLVDNVTESLIRRDPDTGDLLPALATEWEQVDGRTYDFTLRSGVTFSDGTPPGRAGRRRCHQPHVQPGSRA